VVLALAFLVMGVCGLVFVRYRVLGLGFFAIPVLGLQLAIDPTTRRPGVGVLINLRTGPSSAAGGEIRYLLLGQKRTTGGTATVETLYEDMADADAVGTLAGVGSQAHLAAQRLFEEHPTASVDLVVLTESGGNAAAGTVTLDDATAVSVDQTLVVTICGREVEIVWAAGETDIVAATRLVAKIGAMTKELPVTAANGGGTLAVVTLTAKSKGPWGNDVKISYTLTGGTGGAVTLSGAALSGGTTEPSVATALGLVAQREYRLIVPCLSNADLANASTTSNMGRIKTHITGKNTGIGALLQTAHSACTDSTTNAKAMSNQHDTEYFSHHLVRGALSLPCEWGAAIAGIYGREIGSDPNHNFIGVEFKAELYGSPTIDSDALTAAEIEDLLTSGVSYVGYTLGGGRTPRLERPITTYFEDSDGNPDDRILDVGKVFGAIAVGSDLRVFAQRTFAGKKLLPSLPSGNTPIPPNIVEEKDAQGLIVGRIRSQWVASGVVNGTRLDEVLADGSLIVRVNPIDETQLDVFLPLRIVPPLVKTSITIVQA
jgi:phage tail sheath gpL-like